ncbi:hypothetical protein [Actinacidiphila bryophytorum]|uniref:hypothetical protein n=1 Tax=Actinacidiphila bryophytorum TaxID=1436133 RepID=UPI002176D687|nr:hypothetical protein [Actinacidiphila bryophytorum]UWE07676.1 hypothetical protein NYE86_02300 [Actinacidiphila bryophytorum]
MAALPQAPGAPAAARTGCRRRPPPRRHRIARPVRVHGPGRPRSSGAVPTAAGDTSVPQPTAGTPPTAEPTTTTPPTADPTTAPPDDPTSAPPTGPGDGQPPTGP